MRWPLTFYTDFGVPDGSAGCARGPAILIRPTYRDDAGLHAHEMEHVWQGMATLFIGHALLYLFFKPYRLWAEVKAYRKQLELSPGRKQLFAGFIANDYGLDITVENAGQLLIGP